MYSTRSKEVCISVCWKKGISGTVRGTSTEICARPQRKGETKLWMPSHLSLPTSTSASKSYPPTHPPTPSIPLIFKASNQQVRRPSHLSQRVDFIVCAVLVGYVVVLWDPLVVLLSFARQHRPSPVCVGGCVALPPTQKQPFSR